MSWNSERAKWLFFSLLCSAKLSFAEKHVQLGKLGSCCPLALRVSHANKPCLQTYEYYHCLANGLEAL